MCIIIDINTLGSVFSKDSVDHNEFEPIFNWVTNGNGKIVYGGSKYCDELFKTGKYYRLFRRYADARRVIKLPNECVDKVQAEVESKITDGDFDDPHLISIAIVSKCRIICTKDKRFISFATNPAVYPRRFKRPRIYQQKSNKDLIHQGNIADICKPCDKLKKVKVS